jgi:hypothetical protein
LRKIGENNWNFIVKNKGTLIAIQRRKANWIVTSCIGAVLLTCFEGNGREDAEDNLRDYWMTLWKREDIGT